MESFGIHTAIAARKRKAAALKKSISLRNIATLSRVADTTVGPVYCPYCEERVSLISRCVADYPHEYHHHLLPIHARRDANNAFQK